MIAKKDTTAPGKVWLHCVIAPVDNMIIQEAISEGHANTKSDLIRRLIADFGRCHGLPRAAACCGDADCPEE